MAVLWLGGAAHLHAQDTPAERVAVVEQVWGLVTEQFYDPQLNGLNADTVLNEYRQRARSVNETEFADLVNEMLAPLDTSHTAYFSPDDPRRYQMLGIFEFLVPDADDPRLIYEGIGIETVKLDQGHFVKSVYDGTPAARAGILYGDELLTVDGEPWSGLRSFRGKAGGTVNVTIRRKAGATPLEIEVPVENLNGRRVFEDALRASVRKIERDGVTVGYMHLWSYAGARYHAFVQEQLLWGDLKDCDAVILDLRDGWGGAGLDFLNIFREPLARTASVGRDGSPQSYDGAWTRPVVIITNSGSTSGKELYAYAFKKHGFGEIVGTTTAGAVMAGTPRLLESGGVLYLAVRDVRVDGERLEGVGVAPTIPVERPLPYAAGADPQLEKALEVAASAAAR